MLYSLAFLVLLAEALTHIREQLVVHPFYLVITFRDVVNGNHLAKVVVVDGRLHPNFRVLVSWLIGVNIKHLFNFDLLYV